MKNKTTQLIIPGVVLILFICWVGIIHSCATDQVDIIQASLFLFR